MRRAEMARRRRNLSEKRNEEVKVINRSLNTQFCFRPAWVNQRRLDGNHQQTA